MLLEKLLQQPANSPKLHLRDAVYGSAGQSLLLQEVLGMANADCRGVRHIVFGVVHDDAGKLAYSGLSEQGLTELEAGVELVSRYIEPALKVEPIFGSVEGHLLAALEISRCDNPPYMVKTDASRDLRRGDCWVREGGLFRPAQRADLDRMYRNNVQQAGSDENNIVRLGFNDNPGLNKLSLVVPEVSGPPSSHEAVRMRNEIDARKEAQSINVEDTGLARLVHARLYGSERPFEEQGITTLVEGYNTVLDKYQEEDDYFYFETHALKLNFSIVNTGHTALEDVSVVLMLPWAKEFRTADRLYGPPGKSRTAKESELLGYPRVKRYKSTIQVKQEVVRLEPDETVALFEQALRVAVLPSIAGKKVAIRYSVHANGFERPEEGRLKLVLGNMPG